MSRLPPKPELEWAEGIPRAGAFGDVYFSVQGGLAEAEAVSLAGCGLPQAWRDKDRFAICELGFGVGLNVLAAWKAWKSTRQPHAILHICSIEAFPLARDEAARALAHFPELSVFSQKMLARWPVRAYAPQRLWFPEDGFALTLFTGEAEAALASMIARFDAWFLDGFTPARNPAMWSEAIFTQMARLSAPGARVGAFTVAGNVRRGLEAAGFAVEKRPGFGAKRERLEARFAAASAPGPRLGVFPYAAAEPGRVAIIGAGIAGAACAAALARRGRECVVLEAAAALGAGASGNPAGLATPRLDRGGPLREVFLAAYLEAVATYQALGVFERLGVLQLGDEDAVLADLLADPPLPEDWFAPAPGGALHKRAGLVRPQAAIAAMLGDGRLILESPVAAMKRAGEGWVLYAPDGRALLKADAVVLACGAGLARFEPGAFLPLEFSRGQIEWGPLARGPAPRNALTRSNYVAPFEGGLLFGATFDRTEAGAAAAADGASRARNLAALENLTPELAARVDRARLESRASTRVALPDRAPVMGLLPDVEAWRARYAGLAHGRAPEGDGAPPAHRGVYVLGALGARGLTLAPLLGECVAAEISGEPAPLSRTALEAIHPARFLLRALKRGG